MNSCQLQQSLPRPPTLQPPDACGGGSGVSLVGGRDECSGVSLNVGRGGGSGVCPDGGYGIGLIHGHDYELTEPASSSAAKAATARATDGDYEVVTLTRRKQGQRRRLRPLASSAAARSFSAVQAKLIAVKVGG